MILDLRIQSKAACDFLDHWIAVALANPDLIFAGKPEKAAAFKQNQPALSRLIQSARSVTGLEGELFEENGVRRTTLRIGWKE